MESSNICMQLSYLIISCGFVSLHSSVQKAKAMAKPSGPCRQNPGVAPLVWGKPSTWPSPYSVRANIKIRILLINILLIILIRVWIWSVVLARKCANRLMSTNITRIFPSRGCSSPFLLFRCNSVDKAWFQKESTSLVDLACGGMDIFFWRQAFSPLDSISDNYLYVSCTIIYSPFCFEDSVRIFLAKW